MKEQKHTAGPWVAKVIDGVTEREPYILGSNREEIAVMLDWATRPIFPLEQQANADRIVACVNACEGINPEAVPGLVATLQGAADMLRESAKMHCTKGDLGHAWNCLQHASAAHTAIAKATQ